MPDKVLAIIRETLLHENTLDAISFQPGTGEAFLTLSQPDERYAYPDHELLLIFSGVRSMVLEDRPHPEPSGDEVLKIDCIRDEATYTAEICIGARGTPRWTFRLVFAELRYDRSPKYP